MLFFIILIFTGCDLGWAASPLYVQGESLQARKEPSASGAVSFSLFKGQAVNSMESQGIWVKIKFEGKEGWVPSISLSKSKIEAPKSLLNTNTQIDKNSRKRSNAVSTAGAARGLLESEKSLVSALPQTNFKALQKMASFRVPPESVKDFVR